jgi:hypothetical protein
MVVEGLAEMLTLAAPLGLTVIVSAFEVAGDPVAQARLDVITQVTTFPFVRAVVVYVSLFVPTLVVPTFH